MNRIKTFLFAIIVLMGITGVMTSCQEDAPVINYTMNVTVTNDFKKVVEAIENGFLKNEDAVKKLTESIDKMNADQAGKLQSILDVLGNVNTTLETKLAAIEAAMKAQTLSLEGKLDLLKAAIEALPDYSSQLEALKAAIEALPDYSSKLDALAAAIDALPDYSSKFDAVVDALNAMKTQVEALGTGQTAIAEKIGEITTAINDLIAAVISGDTSAAAALAQIIQKLEELKGNIGGGDTPGGGEIILDGVTMPIIDAGIDEDEFNEGNYDIVLFVSEDKGIKIMAGKEPHDGKTIDLTKKEPKRDDDWYWSVECYNPNLIFDTYGEPGTGYPVFMSGTLYVKLLGSEGGKPVFEIVLKNGKVKGEGEYGDGKEHTISLNYKGTLRFDDY